jgi:hypothetical protein
MKRSLSFVFAILIFSVLVSCDPKPEPAEITSLDTYTDEVLNFSVKYPSNWATAKSPGVRFVCFSDENGKSRFTNYDTEGLPVAKVDVFTGDIDSVNTFEEFMKVNKRFAPDTYSSPEKIKIDGIECIKQTYEFELTDGICKGEIYYGTKDNQKAALLQFEAFGGTFEAYKPKFDEIVASFVLPVKPEPKAQDTITELVEQDPPSSTLKQVKGEGYMMQIPENFQRERGYFIGLRRGDSFLRVDVKDVTDKTNLEKTVDQSIGNFPSASKSKTKMGGKDAFKISYKPSGQVDGAVYFTINNGKLFKVTINWFKGEEADYKPIFEKCVSTFKFR